MADFDRITVDGVTKNVKDSTARLGLADKVDKVAGKGLSEEDFTTTFKSKLEGIETGAEVNVQSDWNEADSSSDAYIANKPSIPAAQIQSDWNQADNTQVDYIKNKPTIPAAQVNADWNSNSGKSEILHKPTLSEGRAIRLTQTAVGDSGIDTEIECLGATDYQSASLPAVTGTDYGSYQSGGYVSLANTTYKSVGTVNLTAGTWIMEVTVRFAANVTGVRFFGVSTSKNASSWGSTDETIIDAVQTNATTGGNSTFISHTYLLNCTATTRFHIVAYQNSGSALNVYPRVRYIKIRSL